MNLPFILDVGIGLVFIFLTLSLLASEIQELLATLLQWRAKHLKQAIETLLAGENKIEPTPDAPDDQPVQVQISQSKELANSLYSHPLIRSLNQEAKGILGQVGQAVSQLTQTARVFSGRSSGPSYLPSDAFATTLLETLRADDLMHKLSEVKLNRLLQTKLIDPIREIILDLRNSTANDSLLDPEFQLLESELGGISQTFTRREITLASSFAQTVAALQRLITASEAALPQDDSVSQTFLKRLSTIAEEMPSLQNESKPSIVETMSELSTMSWVAQQLRQHRDYRIAFTRLQDPALRQRLQQGYALLQVMKELVKEATQGREDYEQILTNVSPHLRDSLILLAKRAQLRVEDVEQSATQLQQEVALWFDRAMDRTSGVYKRNAKGVAIVIGFLLAISTNTDTLHIVNKLAKDPTLRATYSQAVDQLVSSSPESIACLEAPPDSDLQANCFGRGGIDARLASLRRSIDGTTELPIGWSEVNWQDQWQPGSTRIFSRFNLFLGWTISAIAISMGAPFWFNLLNKVVNVRNSGKPPAPAPPDPPVPT